MGKRINLFGGPCAGKSTTAAWVFSELKREQVPIEHVGEYVKAWAYEKRDVCKWDQVYLLGKQMQYEYRFLKHGQNIITDSPILLSVIYSKGLNDDITDDLRRIVQRFDLDHNCLNIFLNRKDKPYQQQGRWQTEDEARIVDGVIKYELDNHGHNYVTIDWKDRHGIFELCKDFLNE